MRRHFLLLTISIVAVGGLPPSLVGNTIPQDPASSGGLQSGVVLTQLSKPVYPPLARATRIIGDVTLLLGIRQDGSVESTVIVNGHPLLQQAALESAQQSQFECGGCIDTVTRYSLVYTFQLAEGDCSTATNGPSNDPLQDGKPRARVIQSQNHVTIMDQPLIMCDPAATVRKVRSAKCLYLWRCSSRLTVSE